MAEEVIGEILWTDSARVTFNNIIEYLHKEWTEKEVGKFIKSTMDLLLVLRRYPKMCRPSLKRKNVRNAILRKHIQLIYYYKPGTKQIQILLFWNSKQDSARFRY